MAEDLMSEQRHGERHLLEPPGVGTLRITQDVEVVCLDSAHVVVVTPQIIPKGERLLLEIADDWTSYSQTWVVRALSSRIATGDNGLKREVTLAVSRQPDGGVAAFSGDSSSSVWLGSRIGAIVRRVPIRLSQVSASGCLWDSPAPIGEGVVGFMDVRASNRSHSEAVRIVRTWRAVDGFWPHRSAVEFLTTAPPSLASLRGVAAMMAVGDPSRRVP
jgi:hypothetical protein